MKNNSVFLSKDFGYLKINIRDIMEKNDITRNKLSKLTGCKYDVIDRYYEGENIIRLDTSVLAKICFVLNCDISDILDYRPPES